VNQVYLDSARLLTRVAPLVLVDDTFALKGGTAINLFVRDMPRLSVDLDLVFPDHTLPRERALKRLQKQCFQTHAPAAVDSGEIKLLVRRGGIEVKIEAPTRRCGSPSPASSPWLGGCAISASVSGAKKVYSLHAPEVECIGKGKAHKPYEFGAKVSVATPMNRCKGGQSVAPIKALPGAPYDGHTLAAVLPEFGRADRREPHPHPRRRQLPRPPTNTA
jgi:hypothetical protein